MRNLITSIAAAVATLSFLAPAQEATASHNSPLYRAACNYREATRDFQHAVIRSRYLDHYAERAADRLGDAASRLAASARHIHHPVHHERVLLEWNQIKYLQPRLKAIVFANPGCPSRVELLPCWERVTCAFEALAIQLQPVCGTPFVAPRPVVTTPVIPTPSTCFTTIHPFSGGPVVPRFDVPRGQPNYRVPDRHIPNYRVPNHSVPNYQVPPPVIPERVIPDRALPNLNAPRPGVVPGTQPTHWNRHLRQDANPYWNAHRSNAWASDHRLAKTRKTSPVHSYRGVDVAQIGALLSRLID